MKTIIGAVILACLSTEAQALDISKVPESDWIQLFNGKDIKDWTPKIVGTVAGQDPLQTFRVQDSILYVDYKNYGGQFNGRYGHLSYHKRQFSYYLFHVESNHWGDKQTPGGPGWAYENNGVMYHSQSMESMGLNQEFPDSFEYQLLGESNKLNTGAPGSGTTANVCGVGNSIFLDGKRQSPQCYNAKHVQIDSSHWVVTEGLILGDSIVKHMVAPNPTVKVDTVLTYTKLQHSNGTPMNTGYIDIQGESTPWKFKVIKVLDLEGCMDSKYTSYRSYFIKSKPSACANTVKILSKPVPDGFSIASTPQGLRVIPGAGAAYEYKVLDLAGKVVGKSASSLSSERMIPTQGFKKGIYFLEILTGHETYRSQFPVLASNN